VPSGDVDVWLGTWEVRWGRRGRRPVQRDHARLRRSRGRGALRRRPGADLVGM